MDKVTIKPENDFEAPKGVEFKTLYKYELAMLYKVDIKTLVVWMQLFIAKLENLGYHKNMKKLTPKMVRCIIDHLGEPQLDLVKFFS